MEKILITTLGESPSVVTEAIDLLEQQKISIKKIIILTTSDIDAQESLALLYEHIPDYYGGKVEITDVRYTKDFNDIASTEAAVKFMSEACSVLNDNRKVGYELYVSIAGGRKTMSALLALAVQFYGANMLFHVLIDDPEFEEKGNIDFLKNLDKEEKIKYLHPPISKLRMVNLPFIGLFPWIGQILEALGGGETNKKIRELLVANNLINRDGVVTELGQMIRNILTQVESRPEPRKGRCDISLSTKEPKEREFTKKWAEKLCNRFLFITRVEDFTWREGESKVKVVSPNELEIFLPGKKVQGIGFKLKTTAKTKGQLEMAKRELEDWLNRVVR